MAKTGKKTIRRVAKLPEPPEQGGHIPGKARTTLTNFTRVESTPGAGRGVFVPRPDKISFIATQHPEVESIDRGAEPPETAEVPDEAAEQEALKTPRQLRVSDAYQLSEMMSDGDRRGKVSAPPPAEEVTEITEAPEESSAAPEKAPDDGVPRRYSRRSVAPESAPTRRTGHFDRNGNWVKRD